MTPPDPLRRKLLQAAFQMPSVANMLSRTSSITNAFVNALVPQIPPTIEEIETALTILEMDPVDMRCAYCGNVMTEWDHLRPVVSKKRPTGYITEIANLVPACNKCNSSKGSSNWREWMLRKTPKHSPTRRGIADIAARIERLGRYESWREPIVIDFELVLGKEVWADYWKHWEQMIADLRKCQEVADTLRAVVARSIRN